MLLPNIHLMSLTTSPESNNLIGFIRKGFVYVQIKEIQAIYTVRFNSSEKQTGDEECSKAP